MRNLLFLLLAGLTFFSCSDDYDDVLPHEDPTENVVLHYQDSTYLVGADECGYIVNVVLYNFSREVFHAEIRAAYAYVISCPDGQSPNVNEHWQGYLPGEFYLPQGGSITFTIRRSRDIKPVVHTTVTGWTTERRVSERRLHSDPLEILPIEDLEPVVTETDISPSMGRKVSGRYSSRL